MSDAPTTRAARPDLPRLAVGLGILTGQVRPGSGIGVSEEYRAIVSLAETAESLGFDSVWLSEHHGADDAYLPSLLPMLGAIAAVTDRIQLGTAVLIPSLHHPIRLAEDVAVIDQLSRGRVVLGLGLGWRTAEFRTFGVQRSERAGRTAEIVAILRRAWSNGGGAFHGTFYHFDRMDVRPLPYAAGGPPIYLAGSQETPIRRAARLADGLIYSRSGPTAARVQPDVERLAQALDWVADERSHGPSGAPFPITLCLNAFVSRGDPWAIVGPGIDYQFIRYMRWKKEEAGAPVLGEEERAAARAGRRLTLIGEPRAVAEALLEWVNPVVRHHPLHLVVRLHYPGVPVSRTTEAMGLFAREVLPLVKGRLSQQQPCMGVPPTRTHGTGEP